MSLKKDGSSEETHPSTSSVKIEIEEEASLDEKPPPLLEILPSGIGIGSSTGFFKFSKKCKEFNKLFHASFDDDSTSTSSNSLEFDKNIKVKEEAAEVLLEIEIETETILQEESIDVRNNSENISIKVKTEPAEIHSSAIKSEDDEREEDEFSIKKPKVEEIMTENAIIGQRKSLRLPQISTSSKTNEAQIIKRISLILKRDPESIDEDDKILLDAFPTLVKIVKKRLEARLLSAERMKEFEDSEEILEEKINQLAQIISSSKYLVVYTGAGISTQSGIPDYRGSTGVWTMLKCGKAQNLDSQVLTTANPSITHMCISKLYTEGIIKHVVSQNCDGLHLRSGIPKLGLSELHGNMYVEHCSNSKCGRDYVRKFDVAANTRKNLHQTGRQCYQCGHSLRDTIVHFGERGKLRWPINWAGAEYNSSRADVILCIGSSLKVLRRYPWLFSMDKPVNKRPKLLIINLMWTPKDKVALLKINGKCDYVMEKVMSRLNMTIPLYSKGEDPLFRISTPLHPSEAKSSKELAFPEDESQPSSRMIQDVNNYIQFEPIFRTENYSSDESESDSRNSSSGKFLNGARTRSKTKKSGGTLVPKTKKRVVKNGGGSGGWLSNLTPGYKVKKKKLKITS